MPRSATTAEATVAPRARWWAALGLGLLAEVATIAVIVVAATVVASRLGADAAARQAAGMRLGAIIGPVGGVVFTGLAAWRLARRPLPRPVAHGLVVAVAAIALHVAGAIGGGQGLSPLAVAADVGKLLAGAGAAGWRQRLLLARRTAPPPPPRPAATA